jgi:2-isopropylmalate synthase
VIHGQILAQGGRAFELEALSTTSGTGTLPVASVSLRTPSGEKLREAATGDGPVDAVYRAIEKITKIPITLREYEITSVSTGEDAQGEVSIEVEHPTGVYRGRAVSTDIIEGSARAFLDVVNRIAVRIAPQGEAPRAELGTI